MDCSSEQYAKSTEDDSGDDDDHANFDHVTQILPECFVSVKLENSDDCCEKVKCMTAVHFQENNSSRITPQLCNMSSIMQHCTSPGCKGSSHCFFPHCSSGITELPQLPPWLTSCFTTQSTPSFAEYPQPIGLNHSTSVSPSHVTNANSQPERLLKTSGGRLEKQNLSTTGGNPCDSNTFFNCMLNQQRTGGILFFDPGRSTHLTADGEKVNTNIRGGALEMEATVCKEPMCNSDSQKDAQLTTSKSEAASLSLEEGTKIVTTPVQNSSDSCSVASANSNNSTPSVTCNTASKYSQTVSYASFQTNVESDIESNTNSDSQKSCHKSDPKKNCPCNSLECEIIENSKSEQRETNENVSSQCQAVSAPSIDHVSTCCCKRFFVSKSTTQVDNINKFEVPTCMHFQHACHCICSEAHLQSPLKAENITAHCFNSTSKVPNEISRKNLTCGRMQTSGTTCSNICDKPENRDVNKPFTCGVCFKTYPTSIALMNHTRYHRGERPYQCETCNKAFATNSHLVTHRRVHTGERPFQCQLCHRSFADRSAFVKHERTHGPNGTIIKRFHCEECGNAFVDSCGLKKHIRIHTGERPYQCTVCEKTFSTSSTFVAHKRIHSGERPYKCDQCSKMFITKSHLLTHRRTHTGEKPFMCQVCSRAFADGSSFRRHERLHTGENRYVCDVCGKGFPFDTSLVKHKQSHIPGSATYVYMV